MKKLTTKNLENVSAGADCATKAGFMTGLLTFGIATAFTPFGQIALFAGAIYGLIAVDGCY